MGMVFLEPCVGSRSCMPNLLPVVAKALMELVRNPLQVRQFSHQAYSHHLGNWSLSPTHPYLRGCPQLHLLPLPIIRKVILSCVPSLLLLKECHSTVPDPWTAQLAKDGDYQSGSFAGEASDETPVWRLVCSMRRAAGQGLFTPFWTGPAFQASSAPSREASSCCFLKN